MCTIRLQYIEKYIEIRNNRDFFSMGYLLFLVSKDSKKYYKIESFYFLSLDFNWILIYSYLRP